MRKKIFKPIQIGSATALLAVTSFLSYAIGLLRDKIIAFKFGASAATDAYSASFIIPDMLFNLFIAGALVAAFLPVFSEHLTKDKKKAQEIANTVLTGGVILISSLAILAFIFMPQIVPFLFGNSDIELQESIIKMTRLMLPSAILFAISNTLGNILMSYKHFIAYSLSPILYNLGIILGITFLSDSMGIYSAATGVLIGASLHAAIRIIDITTTEYNYKPQLKIKDPAFKKIIKLMLPKTASLIAWQINLYIFTAVGLRILEGSVAAFNFARNIQSFAVSLFGIAFATAVFPYLTTTFSEENYIEYTGHIQKTIQRILFFTIPATVGVMVLAEPLVNLILGGGAFNENSAQITALILFYFGLSIPFESLVHILARAFYARQNTLTPMIINISTMVVIALITLFVAPIYGVQWFSIGFSIGFAFQVVLLSFILRKKLEQFNIKSLSKSVLKTIISSSIMLLVLLLLKPLHETISSKLATVIQIVVGAGSYFVSAMILKSSEISSISYIFNRIFKKNV